MSTPTIHNQAKKGEIAKTVLMPGDPIRAKYIAENYLENARLVSDVRKICCYTGTHQGKNISIMASGMGTGSMSIYSYELFHFYDVDSIIRVGSAGGIHPSVKLRDIVIAQASSTDNGYTTHLNLPGTFAPCASFDLIERAVRAGRELGVSMKVGPVVSGEGFYYSDEWFEKWSDMGVLAVEMESAALYVNAARAKKKAVAICTISDLIFENVACTVDEREQGFADMIRVALSLAD